MNAAQKFETENKLRPTEAARMLGVSYSLWKKLRTGEKQLQAYHIASIEAHAALNNTEFQRLKSKRIKPKSKKDN